MDEFQGAFPMHRRDWLTAAGAAGVPLLLQGGPVAAAQGRKLPALRMFDVKTVLTAPAGIRLVVVKVATNEAGLYGLGCATFTQRARVVETAIDKYLKRFQIGKDPLSVGAIFPCSFVSSYRRNDGALNNALSGVDMALWDILGKRAGMPVYQLWGGKCRAGVDTYRHASGKDFATVEKMVRQFMDKGYRHVRIQVAVPGLSTYGTTGLSDDPKVPLNRRAQVWEPGPYVRIVPRLFEHIRKQVGDRVELLHYVHERVPPILALHL